MKKTITSIVLAAIITTSAFTSIPETLGVQTSIVASAASYDLTEEDIDKYEAAWKNFISKSKKGYLGINYSPNKWEKAAVKGTQAMLNFVNGNKSLSVDGVYGENTAKAMLAYQRSKSKLDNDACCGPQTFKELVSDCRIKLMDISISVSDYEPDELGRAEITFKFSGQEISKVTYTTNNSDYVKIINCKWSPYPNTCYADFVIWGQDSSITLYLLSETGEVIGQATAKAISTSPYESILETIAENEIGNNYKKYGGGSDTPWCGYAARYIALEAIKEAYGYDTATAKSLIPYDQLSGACTTAYAYMNSNYGSYYSFADWKYSYYSWQYGKKITAKGTKNTSSKNFTPKVGSFILTETNNNLNDGVDHIGLITKVNSDGSFVAVEGNTNSSLPCNKRTVKKYTYVKSNYNGIESYIRKDCSGITCRVIAICEPEFLS